MAADQAIRVWETPNRGMFKVYIPGDVSEPAKIRVTDIAGRQIKELTTVSGQDVDLTLDVGEGLYILNVATSSENFTTRIRIEK